MGETLLYPHRGKGEQEHDRIAAIGQEMKRKNRFYLEPVWLAPIWSAVPRK